MITYKLAIIGYPLTHSLSGVMQNAALKASGLEGEYETLETKPENLIQVIKKFKTEGYQGFNVTIPHKVPVTLFLNECDELANLTGSVNTVKILEDKSLSGYNTDVYGFIKSLPEGFSVNEESAAVLGTGGASRAIVAGLVHMGIKEIDLFSRNIIDSHETAQILRGRFPNVAINLLQNQMLANLEKYKIIVNTTPIGMRNYAESISPLSDETVETLREDALISDIVYNPFKTELIKQAARYGKKYAGGLDMLVFQGAKAFEIWTGIKPDADKMKVAALEALM